MLYFYSVIVNMQYAGVDNITTNYEKRQQIVKTK